MPLQIPPPRKQKLASFHQARDVATRSFPAVVIEPRQHLHLRLWFGPGVGASRRRRTRRTGFMEPAMSDEKVLVREPCVAAVVVAGKRTEELVLGLDVDQERFL